MRPRLGSAGSGLVSAATAFARDAAYRSLTLGARWRLVALPAARMLHHGEVVGPATQLVIEGFPRSANSLAVASLIAAGVPRDRIAHHTHTPANLFAGIRQRVPCLLVVRHPSDAVPAFVATKPSLTAGAALRGWVSFHRPLTRSLDHILVATFEQVTNDMPAVVSRMNGRFGSAFPMPDQAQMEDAAAGIDQYWRGRTGHGLPVLGRGRGAGDVPASLSGFDATPQTLRDSAAQLFDRLERSSH